MGAPLLAAFREVGRRSADSKLESVLRGQRSDLHLEGESGHPRHGAWTQAAGARIASQARGDSGPHVVVTWIKRYNLAFGTREICTD